MASSLRAAIGSPVPTSLPVFANWFAVVESARAALVARGCFVSRADEVSESETGVEFTWVVVNVKMTVSPLITTGPGWIFAVQAAAPHDEGGAPIVTRTCWQEGPNVL